MDFYIVQHGQKVRGVLDPGLTGLGQLQAQATGEYLRGAAISKIVSSPLRRARETARYIGDALVLDVSFDERLQERMDWKGSASNLTIEEFIEEWSKATNERIYVPPVGDSSVQAGERFKAVLDDLMKEQSPTPCVVVAHGGVSTDLLRTLFGDDTLNRRKPRLIAYGVPGCAITHIRATEDAYELISLASLEHLQEHQRSDHKPV